MEAPTKLKQFRKELNVTQEGMAQEVGVRLNTYARVERGKNVSYSTAVKILNALNTLRANRELPPIERVEDLGLSVV
jgi:DNA-binding XRE family transcriptional regulator